MKSDSFESSSWDDRRAVRTGALQGAAEGCADAGGARRTGPGGPGAARRCAGLGESQQVRRPLLLAPAQGTMRTVLPPLSALLSGPSPCTVTRSSADSSKPFSLHEEWASLCLSLVLAGTPKPATQAASANTGAGVWLHLTEAAGSRREMRRGRCAVGPAAGLEFRVWR